MLTSRVFSGWLYFNMLTIRKIAKSKLINAKRKQNSAEYQTNVNVPLHLNLVRRFYLPDLLRFLNTYYYIIYIVLYYILLYFMYIILLYTLVKCILYLYANLCLDIFRILFHTGFVMLIGFMSN